jgi:hypothetical protein
VVRNGQPIQPTPAAPPPAGWLAMLGLSAKEEVGAR